MYFRQLFFIEGRLLGEASRGLVRIHNIYAPPTSDLYFCSCCGDVYAKCPCLSADGLTTPWQSFRGMCRKCAPKHQHHLSEWPGSISRSYDEEFTAALPVSVLQWELQRHLDSYERFPHGYQ